jgi:hypothetical protein
VAETVVINIEANTQGLQSTIDLLVKLGKVEQSVADDFKKTNEQNIASLNKGVQTTIKGIETIDKAIKNLKGDNTLAASLDGTAPLTKTGNSIQSMKSRLKEAVAEAQLLADQFGDLDPRAIEAAKSAAKLKDQIDDTNKRIAALNPENKFNAIKNLGGAIGGVFQVATGSLQAFGVESEAATKIAQQFQGALNIFSGLSQLAQFKDALVEVKAALGLTSVATTTQTVATEGLAVAEGEATVAQNALNKSVLANPYVIAAAALAGLVAAVYAFVASNDEAEESQKRLNKELESSNTYYQGVADFLSRSSKERIKDGENAIKLAELEGKSVKEVGELKKQQARLQNQLYQEQIDANYEQIIENEKLYDELLKLATEDSQKKTEELAKQIDEKKKANKELVSAQKQLASDFKVLEAQITSDVKEENEKRVKEAKDAREKIKKEQLESALADIKKKYADERTIAAQTAKDKETFEILNTEITGKEIRAQMALYDKSSKEYKQLYLDLQKFAQDNVIQTAPTSFELGTDSIEKSLKAAEKEIKPITTVINVNAEPENLKKAKEQLKELFKDIQDALLNALGTAVFDQINKGFENQIDNINKLKDEQLNAISEEEATLQSSYDNRRIGKEELERNQKKLALERINAEKKAEQELNEIRRKQDLAKKAQALFDIALSTAKAVMAVSADITVPLVAKPALIGATIALGAVQAAAVLAQPLPKYKKGTLSVPGVGSDDSQMALLQPGEAVIPTDTNRRYAPAIKAIYNGSIRPDEINAFVKMRLKGDYAHSKESVTAKMDISDLYALGRIMKKNDGVTVKNIGELAVLLSNAQNPRR